jgi:POT family proton-dependent oligopeptide transporter
MSTEAPGYATPGAVTPSGGTFFGQPRGLATLFFTEMWERFSYYGMRALLVLFMTASAVEANAGMGLDVGRATAIYGLYTALVYLMSLPGGWVADNLYPRQGRPVQGGAGRDVLPRRDR